MQIGLGIALGAGIGTAIVVALGSGGAWWAIGIAIGVIIGTAMSRKAEHAPSLPKASSSLTNVAMRRFFELLTHPWNTAKAGRQRFCFWFELRANS
jgi:hypothetical protein